MSQKLHFGDARAESLLAPGVGLSVQPNSGEEGFEVQSLQVRPGKVLDRLAQAWMGSETTVFKIIKLETDLTAC